MEPTKLPYQAAPGIATLSTRSVNREELITDAAIGHMYRSLPNILANLFIMPLVLAIVMWEAVNQALLLGWVGLTLAIIVARYGLARAYARRQPQSGEGLRWAHYFTATSLISGIAWGFAGIVFFTPSSVATQVFLYVSIVGLAAGSTIATCYWLPAFFAFAVPSVCLGALRLALEGDSAYIGLSVLLFMYLVILMRVALKQAQSVREVLRLQFENTELVEQLREQMEIADRARLSAENARHNAEQANVAKSKFLAAASHDLRQPLHALGLFVAALGNRSDSRETRVLVEHINSSVAALEGLFNALLDVSKLDAGAVQPRVVDVALAPLLAQLSLEYQPQAAAKGLAWHCSDSNAVIRSDPALLDTILRNLLSNAIRYTHKGKIAVNCQAGQNDVRIDISDTGIGIPAERQREVFDEFVQLHNPERDRNKGLGLGLAIVDRLSRLLGHSIELISCPGRGTNFRLTLAAGNPALVMPAFQPESVSAEPILASDLVVVIDDETAVRIAMTELLETWGYQVLAVASADEAMGAINEQPVAVIADYRLRENQTGDDAVRRIHAAWGDAIPAMIVTGDTAPERLRVATLNGFALRHKPVSPARLRAFLRHAHRQRAAEERMKSTTGGTL
jgi:signal transduction histidine kinase/CheY-like chemotaxis protein